MRIVLIGQAAFGAKTLEALLAEGEKIVAVYTRPDEPGARPDPLKELASSRGIPVFQPSTYKNDQVFAQYRQLEPDLTILAFVTDIIPARYFEAPSHGDHLLPSIAVAASPRRKRHQLGDHHGGHAHRPHHFLAGRRY